MYKLWNPVHQSIMEETGTAGLRAAAPEWTLAGDKKLLDILQNMHQSLMAKCQEVNQRLDEMVTALDESNVDLQNVNNKFMALSNTQFIESRVYDDDADVTIPEKAKEPSKPAEPSSKLDKLKESLKILEEMHEVIQIMDSDTESDSEDEVVTRTVLKPKDVYSHRPLPHIIGSQAWRAKWHAGLMPEQSDSDTSVSKRDEDEEYSSSEPEDVEDRDRLTVPDVQDSTTSSDISSSAAAWPAPQPSAAVGAAALAGGLAGGRAGGQRGSPHHLPESVPEYSPIKHTKVYRPEQPTTATIFSDEPPPLDNHQSEESEEDDIFAELHKNKPFQAANKERGRLADDLFSGLSESRTERDIFDEFAEPTQVANPKLTLVADKSEPELLVDKLPTTRTEADKNVTENVKKPVGGISLFGSNSGTDSIGAAILKRNQRKSSDEPFEEDIQPPEIKKEKVRSTERDIFDDLFAKSVKANKVVNKKDTETAVIKNNNDKTEKVDLFNDNLFDDIDNIFATNIVKSALNTNKKSIFDDDDDDIFADIATIAPKPKIAERKPDLIDDLFSDQNKPDRSIREKESEIKSVIKASDGNSSNEKPTKSIFDDDNVTDIFSKLSNDNSGNTKNSDLSKETLKVESNIDRETVAKSGINNTDLITVNSVSSDNNVLIGKSKQISIFDDDDDDKSNDLDSKNKQKNRNDVINASKEVIKTKPIIKDKPPKSSIFDEEDDDNNIFNNLSISKIDKNSKINDGKVSKVKEKAKLFHDDRDKNIFDDKSTNTINNLNENYKTDQIKNSLDGNIFKEQQSANTDTKSALFDDSDSEPFKTEISSSETTTKTPKHIVIPENKPSVKQLSANTDTKSALFDDSDSEPFKTEISSSETTIKTSKHKVIPENEPSVNDTSIENQDFLPATKSDDILKCDKNDILSGNLTLTYSTDSEQRKRSFTAKEIMPDLPETNFKTQYTEAKLNTLNDTLFSAIPNDIFSDLIDEPPAFEKTKEPKKSKNINALFDDDSDDEALFFKKNDVILDEEPDLNVESNNDGLFGIFHDEPPAIEVDFTQKSNESKRIPNDLDDFLRTVSTKNHNESSLDIFDGQNIKTTKINDILKSENTNENLSNNDGLLPHNTVQNNSKTKAHISIDSLLNSDSDNDFFKTNRPSNASKTQIEPVYQEIDQANVVQKTEIVKSKLPEIPISEDTADSPKKIGRLKSMNININVTSLLPGASPKKKATEDIDGPVLSTKSQEDLHSKEKIEPIMVKSVSFEGDPDSQVLDNKISKERAKIQVKRRPSTRRARKEAVRKSAIDLGDDSTDNSSSFDDIPRPRINQNELKVKGKKTDSEINCFEPHAQENRDNNNVSQDAASKTETVFKSDSKDVKSKIVYILNDEDIFNTNVTKPVGERKGSLHLSDDEENLFSDKASGSHKLISTLGNVYKDTNNRNNEIKVKKSIFDDLREDENELFNTNKKITTKSKGILDSDSDEDLFNKKEKHKQENVRDTEVKRKVEVKASLFGDDEDDDDLFGTKVKVKTVEPTQVKPPREIVTKVTEPVFDDPLTLLGADED